MRLDFGELVVLGDAPCRRAVGDERIGEEDDRGHVLEGDAACLEGHVEAVCRADSRHYTDGGLAVAPVECLQQVGLLGLGGKAGRGTSALHVDDDERELCHYSEAYALALERKAGA